MDNCFGLLEDLQFPENQETIKQNALFYYINKARMVIE